MKTAVHLKTEVILKRKIEDHRQNLSSYCSLIQTYCNFKNNYMLLKAIFVSFEQIFALI